MSQSTQFWFCLKEINLYTIKEIDNTVSENMVYPFKFYVICIYNLIILYTNLIYSEGHVAMVINLYEEKCSYFHTTI